MLDQSFVHRGKVVKLDDSFVHADILKRRLSASGNVSLRRGYDTNANGVRPWVVSLNDSEEHEFDTIEEAESYAASHGLVRKAK